MNVFSSCRRTLTTAFGALGCGMMLAAALLVLPGVVLALQPGQVAPPEVAAAAQQAPALEMGSVTLRSLASVPGQAGLPALQARPGVGHSLVMRQPGNLVGVSYHEVAVVGADVGQVQALLGHLAPQARVRTEPGLGLVIVQLASFDQVVALVPQLQQALPGVAVTVPVMWSLPRVQ